MIQLQSFRTPPGEVSMFKNIPIEYVEQVRAELRRRYPVLVFAFRFRGPRAHPLDTRCKRNRMQDAVKAFANRFSVYARKVRRP